MNGGNGVEEGEWCREILSPLAVPGFSSANVSRSHLKSHLGHCITLECDSTPPQGKAPAGQPDLSALGVSGTPRHLLQLVFTPWASVNVTSSLPSYFKIRQLTKNSLKADNILLITISSGLLRVLAF